VTFLQYGKRVNAQLDLIIKVEEDARSQENLRFLYPFELRKHTATLCLKFDE